MKPIKAWAVKCDGRYPFYCVEKTRAIARRVARALRGDYCVTAEVVRVRVIIKECKG